jgi:hypothetical protein
VDQVIIDLLFLVVIDMIIVLQHLMERLMKNVSLDGLDIIIVKMAAMYTEV